MHDPETGNIWSEGVLDSLVKAAAFINKTFDHNEVPLTRQVIDDDVADIADLKNRTNQLRKYVAVERLTFEQAEKLRKIIAEKEIQQLKEENESSLEKFKEFMKEVDEIKASCAKVEKHEVVLQTLPETLEAFRAISIEQNAWMKATADDQIKFINQKFEEQTMKWQVAVSELKTLINEDLYGRVETLEKRIETLERKNDQEDILRRLSVLEKNRDANILKKMTLQAAKTDELIDQLQAASMQVVGLMMSMPKIGTEAWKGIEELTYKPTRKSGPELTAEKPPEYSEKQNLPVTERVRQLRRTITE